MKTIQLIKISALGLTGCCDFIPQAADQSGHEAAKGGFVINDEHPPGRP
jgi:hypothetical protein